MKKGIFIAGTDTGVGKTYIAAGIAGELRSRGIDVGVMKPAETGCRTRSGRLVPVDAARLMQSAGVRDSLALVNPYRFRKPLAPSVAAAMEGRSIRIEGIVKAYQTLAARHDCMIVEGAGGVMVPLRDGYLFLDLMKRLGLPVVIVARPGLGTINHTLLTIEALSKKRVPVSGIVINYADRGKPGDAERTSPAVIEKLSGVPVIAIMPHGASNFRNLVNHIPCE